MIRFMMVVVIVVGFLFAGYKGVMWFGSNMMIDQVADNVLNDEETERLMNDPEVKELLDRDLSESATADLPFDTKEEALKTVLSKFSMSELNEMKDTLLSGAGAEEKAEILAELEERLTPEELLALKVVAMKEIEGREE